MSLLFTKYALFRKMVYKGGGGVQKCPKIVHMVYGKSITRILQDCIVRDETTQLDTPCIFPFIYQNKIHYGCTKDLHPEAGVITCSTNVTSDFEHIEPYWGKCVLENCTNDSVFTEEDNELAIRSIEIIQDIELSPIGKKY